MHIEIKRPGDCSGTELKFFKALILKGSEIESPYLMDKIKQAYKLIFIRLDGISVAVGALRYASIHYCEEIFTKAGTPHQKRDYTYEVSWFYVAESKRGCCCGSRLMKAAIEAAEGGACFATAREDNRIMHAIFKRYKFERLGGVYPSLRGNYSLGLFARK